jgi:hypothetical protein
MVKFVGAFLKSASQGFLSSDCEIKSCETGTGVGSGGSGNVAQDESSAISNPNFFMKSPFSFNS